MTGKRVTSPKTGDIHIESLWGNDHGSHMRAPMYSAACRDRMVAWVPQVRGNYRQGRRQKATERAVLVGRKKRIGFGDVQATHAELGRGELRCPQCHRSVSDADGLKFVPALGQSESSLATLNCPRCRTMLSIRFIAGN